MFVSIDAPDIEDVDDLYPDPDEPAGEPERAIDLTLAPGARLALQIECAGAVPELLSRTDVLDAVEGIAILQRGYDGLRIRMLAEFTGRHPADSVSAPPGADESGMVPSQRWVPDEVGLTLGLSRLEALGEIAQAKRFVHVLPDTLALLERGRIDLRRAEAIARATAVLPDELARAVEGMVLPKAPDATLRLLRDRLRRAIARVDPDGEYRRHREADRERRVSIRSLEDGMASLWFYGSAAEIEAAWQMADRLARSLPVDDPRTLDQRRFDLAMQVLQGRLTVTDMSDVDTAVDGILAPGRPATNAGDTARAADGTDDVTGTDRGTGETPDASVGASDATGADRGTGDATGADRGTGDATGAAAAGDATCADGAADAAGSDGVADAAGADGAGGDATGADGRAGHGGRANQAGHAASFAHHDPPEDLAPPDTPQRHQVSPEALADAVAEALSRRPDVHSTVRKPLIHVVVGMDTLLGSDRPAELVGHGPIDAATARALAADGVWGRLLTDPLSGTLLDVGRTTYTPPAGLDGHVRARDVICRGPQCGRRIRDLDHRREWSRGGVTAEWNLDGYCLHHHKLKDAAGWQVIAHDDRSLTWISPCGRRYRTEPYDYRPFTDEFPNDDSATHVAAADSAVRAEATDDAPPPF